MLAQIRSHFKNKYVKILTCFFAIALILFTSFSNLFISIFAADDLSDGGGAVDFDIVGTWILNPSLTFPSDPIYVDDIDATFNCYQSNNQVFLETPVSYIRISNDTFKQFTINYSPTSSYFPYYEIINHSGGGTTWLCSVFPSSNGNNYDVSDLVEARTITINRDVDNIRFKTWLFSNGVKQYTGPSYGDLVLGQTRVFKQNPAPVANMLVSDQFSFTDANGNTYNEFVAANMLTDGNPLLYIKYGDVYAYGSIDQSIVLLRTWNQLYYRQITFNELPDDQATIDYILANTTPVGDPDVPINPDDPYQSGYNVGYDVGYQAGLQLGYDNGYNAGIADGDYQNGYQAGYEKGVSNTFVKSFFLNFFTGIVEAIDSIVLFEEDGFTFTMWDVMVSLIVISIIITILVVYRGG